MNWPSMKRCNCVRSSIPHQAYRSHFKEEDCEAQKEVNSPRSGGQNLSSGFPIPEPALVAAASPSCPGLKAGATQPGLRDIGQASSPVRTLVLVQTQGLAISSEWVSWWCLWFWLLMATEVWCSWTRAPGYVQKRCPALPVITATQHTSPLDVQSWTHGPFTRKYQNP